MSDESQADEYAYLCTHCGAEVKFEDNFCKVCGEDVSQIEYAEDETNYSHKHDGQCNSSNHQEQDPITISCLSCSKSVRIAFPFSSYSFRCPNCRGMYEIHLLDNRRPIYLIAPKLTHRTTDAPLQQRAIPEEVRRAFEIFELNVNVTFVEVKTKYRKCMTEYHPDKVAHLGADLRKLAEAKSKEYNAAYNLLQRYFDEINAHK